ncbi:FAD/NAD(P)-binding domain-containing protein [Mollisia scopiformis]|uniref:FAD/NAD(P)-binding domain-containing protein n=1 Tax=Mollisia scopiformis TaxID=149040 RepID=A0A194XRG2_MOLSC|nr:FAD/NAD(P)-binding domain-containing protein [Mollisia scopiformis]KUJ22317.1 FAD/NAD(P)-binding domain-containing protein [Mollisia scopiformis]
MVADIAIVGGGPSGLALAGILERAGLSYIVYERSNIDVPPRGGCLDLHDGGGQLAMKEAGCYEKFREYGRGGEATIHAVWDHLGNKVFTHGEGVDSPELDREQIKQALLTTIPEENIKWGQAVTSSERNNKGDVVLHFGDGISATGFKLVIGADGSNSKIRHLVTPAKPKYAGMMFWTGEIHSSNPFYTKVEEVAKLGPMIVLGRSTMIWIQRQGDGHYRMELGFKGPENFAEKIQVDLLDTEAVKILMLTNDFFGGHADSIKAIIEAIDSSFHAWPLYYMPPDALAWKAAKGVTLIGDAAHVTTPFIGEGANIALLDSVALARKLKEFGISQKAVEEYEKDMFPRARDVIQKSVKSGELYFDWNAPQSVMESSRRGVQFGGLGQKSNTTVEVGV